MSIVVYWVEFDDSEEYLPLLSQACLVLDRKYPDYRYKADLFRHTLGIALAAYAWRLRYPELPLPNISRDQNGKPFFILNGLKPVFSFNISHSGSLVVGAVGESAVGIDVEKIGACPPEVVERYFDRAEQEMLLLVDAAERDRLFYRIWTYKESQLKATGQGLPGLETLAQKADKGNWQVTELSLKTDYAAAVCHASSETVVTVKLEIEKLVSFCRKICGE